MEGGKGYVDGSAVKATRYKDPVSPWEHVRLLRGMTALLCPPALFPYAVPPCAVPPCARPCSHPVASVLPSGANKAATTASECPAKRRG